MALQDFEQRRMFMSEEEYLAFDRASEIKHEYYNGLVVAMLGDTLANDRLAGAMYVLIREKLGVLGPCQVYTSNTRVFVPEKPSKQQYVYPDVTVTCDIADYQDSDIINSPRLIVEVLSPSTEKTDQGDKLKWYKAHPCMQEYVIIHTRLQRVEVHHRSGDIWTYHNYSAGETIELVSLDIQIPVDILYLGLRIPK